MQPKSTDWNVVVHKTVYAKYDRACCNEGVVLTITSGLIRFLRIFSVILYYRLNLLAMYKSREEHECMVLALASRTRSTPKITTCECYGGDHDLARKREPSTWDM